MSPVCGAVTATLPVGNLNVVKRLNDLSYYEVQFPHIWVLSQGDGRGNTIR